MILILFNAVCHSRSSRNDQKCRRWAHIQIRVKITVLPQLSRCRRLWCHLKGEKIIRQQHIGLYGEDTVHPALLKPCLIVGIIFNWLERLIQFKLISLPQATCTATTNSQWVVLRLAAVRSLSNHTVYLTTHYSAPGHKNTVCLYKHRRSYSKWSWMKNGYKEKREKKKIISTFYV